MAGADIKVKTAAELKRLYRRTNFRGRKAPTWDDITTDADGNTFVAECSFFGGTLIEMSGNYERHGEDALFLQELVRLYKAGSLAFREPTWQLLADGPPVEDGKYLVYCPTRDPNSPLLATAWYHADGGWSLLPEHWIAAITHWMPMPAPPGRPRGMP